MDNILMRITDVALSLPALLVLILLSAILREVDPLFERNNVVTIAVVIGLLSWMTFARLVRAIFLTLREMDYVTAVAAAWEARTCCIIIRHILPNAIGPIIVEATLELGYAIIEESGLSFLGFGIQPPTPSWGNLLSNAQENLTKYPWLAIFPGLMIFLTIISVNYIGDGLRDAFDPYKVLEEVGGTVIPPQPSRRFHMTIRTPTSPATRRRRLPAPLHEARTIGSTPGSHAGDPGKVGVRFPSEKALTILADHGAQVDHRNRSSIPPDLVFKAMSLSRATSIWALAIHLDLQLAGWGHLLHHRWLRRRDHRLRDPPAPPFLQGGRG